MNNHTTQKASLSAIKPLPQLEQMGTLHMVLKDGGPGFCQFAINNACNARCGFCNFAVDKLPKANWKYVDHDGALEAVDILYRQGIRYLVITGGEPMLHPALTSIVERAASLKMKVMLVTNGSLLKTRRIHELAEAGLSSFIISIDAASEEVHEDNRGLPGVCERIRDANWLIKRLGLYATASVTMSHLVDYEALPEFLDSLGFTSVTFSYPLERLGSNFLGYSEAGLVSFAKEDLIEAFEQVKRLKRRFRVVNPMPSLEEMQRFLRNEEQRFPCLGGYKYFYLDWDLMLWRCHNWETPMCSIYEFDGSQRVRDGCTRCMIDCYRDSSVMHHIGLSVHDAYQALRTGELGEAAKALMRRGNLGSIRAVLEEVPWLLRF
jgi:MoaA/NifB/PqqE/SkfB family radical SAM enzyme